MAGQVSFAPKTENATELVLRRRGFSLSEGVGAMGQMSGRIAPRLDSLDCLVHFSSNLCLIHAGHYTNLSITLINNS